MWPFTRTRYETVPGGVSEHYGCIWHGNKRIHLERDERDPFMCIRRTEVVVAREPTGLGKRLGVRGTVSLRVKYEGEVVRKRSGRGYKMTFHEGWIPIADLPAV